MDNAGTFQLVAASITNALSAVAQTEIDDLDGMSIVTLEAQFAYGSGGETCSAVVSTTLDGGNTWQDIARFDFTTESAVTYVNLDGRAAQAMTAYSPLGSEGINAGLLGDALRAVLTSTGTYANTTLGITAAVR